MSDIERMLRRGPAIPEGVVAALAARAGDDDLVEVSYCETDSPVGRLILAATRRGLVTVSYGPEDETVTRLAVKLSPSILRSPARLDAARRELDEYFAGRRTYFEVPIDWALTRGFARKVLRATAAIPFGGTATYRDIARRAGSDKAVRAAGNALGSNPLPIVVPCHRVVRMGGGLGGYTGGVDKKQYLLRLEGGTSAGLSAPGRH